MSFQKIDVVKDLYLPLLGAVHIYPDENGGLIRQNGTVSKTCEMQGKRLILPTEANLTGPAPDTVFFHPLSENIARGDSAVYNYLKLAMTLRVNYTIAGLADVLIKVAGDKLLEGKLKSSQLDLVRALPKVNDKMISNLAASVLNMDADKNVLYTVYNKRNGKIGGNVFNRVAVVRFPLLEQLNDVEKSAYWSAVKGLRKADIEAFKALYQYLIPNWNVENQYSGSSDSMEAPSFHALCIAFVNIMTRLNELCNLFADVADTRSLACPDLHVLDQALGNLSVYANVIPPLAGNDGDIATNQQSVNQLQTQPMGVPPAGLLAAADSKLSAVTGTTAPATQQQQVTPGQQAVNQAPIQHAPTSYTQANGGFIGVPPMGMGMGFPTMGQNAYMPNPYMAQPQQMNPYMANQMGYMPANPAAVQQQQMYAQQQQQQLQQQLAGDPIASWNMATNPQQFGMMNPQMMAMGGMGMMGRPVFNTIGQQGQPVMGQQPMQQPMMNPGIGFGGPKFNKVQ